MLALLPPLLLAATACAAPQETENETPRYEGPHCSFEYSRAFGVRDYGTGWGVVVDLTPARNPSGAAVSWMRITSVLSGSDHAELAGQLIGLESQELAAQGLKLEADLAKYVKVELSIAGALRTGLRTQATTADGKPGGTFTMYSWRNDKAVLMARTFTQSEAQEKNVTGILAGLVAPGLSADSQRKVGAYDYGFRIPANWQDGHQRLGDRHDVYTILMPGGRFEALISQSVFGENREKELAGLRRTADTRFEQMKQQGQGEVVDIRESWLNIEGSLVKGRTVDWKGADGVVRGIGQYTYIPPGSHRAVQLQLMPNPGEEGTLLTSVTRMTRLDVYRFQPVAAQPEQLQLRGMRLDIPRDISRMGALGNGFAGGEGVVLGRGEEGGPRWYFWSLPTATATADLEAKQDAWMQQWLQRELPDAKVELQQVMTTELDGRDAVVGKAWTVTHQAKIWSDEDPGAFTLAPPRKWMCALVAVPMSERTLLAAVRVDARDAGTMLEEFRHAVRNVRTTGTDRLEIETFAIDLPTDAPWAWVLRPGELVQEVRLVHPDGQVLAKVEVPDPNLDIDLHATSEAFRLLREVKDREELAGRGIRHFRSTAWTRIGERDLPWERFDYQAPDGTSRRIGGSGWKVGDTRVTWVADGRLGAFQRDRMRLMPEGAGRFDLLGTPLSYGGLRIPQTDRFSWRASHDGTDQWLQLQYRGLRDVPVELHFAVDPGAEVSDEELLKSLMPEEPTWDQVVALHRVPVVRQAFGKQAPGWRITGRVERGPYLHQEVIMDRRDGTVRYLRLEAPAVIYEEAGPLLDDLLAAVRPETEVHVWPAAKAKAGSVMQSVGPLPLALPADFRQVEAPDGEGWFWSDELGASAVFAIPVPPEEPVFRLIHQSVSEAAQLEETSPTVEGGIPAYSTLILADGRTLPGFHASMGGIPAACVAITLKGKNYFLAAYDPLGDGAVPLLQSALTGIDFDAKD